MVGSFAEEFEQPESMLSAVRRGAREALDCHHYGSVRLAVLQRPSRFTHAVVRHCSEEEDKSLNMSKLLIKI